MEENIELNSFLKKKLSDTSLDDSIKKEIRRKIDGSDLPTKMEKESLRYLLWLDAERCSAFFTDIVLICEGASEKVLLEYLVKNEWYNLREIRPYFLDAMGKYNIHRYMNIFKELGIKHSILADSDKNKKVLELINNYLESCKNKYTIKMDYLDENLENFLGIDPPQNQSQKPLNVMWNLFSNNIPQNKLDLLKTKIENLLLTF